MSCETKTIWKQKKKFKFSEEDTKLLLALSLVEEDFKETSPAVSKLMALTQHRIKEILKKNHILAY